MEDAERAPSGVAKGERAGALGPADGGGRGVSGRAGVLGPLLHSLLFSFMNVHMSLSSGLCAKEQFPTYWHFRPFCAWMQSYSVGVGRAS